MMDIFEGFSPLEGTLPLAEGHMHSMPELVLERFPSLGESVKPKQGRKRKRSPSLSCSESVDNDFKRFKEFSFEFMKKGGEEVSTPVNIATPDEDEFLPPLPATPPGAPQSMPRADSEVLPPCMPAAPRTPSEETKEQPPKGMFVSAQRRVRPTLISPLLALTSRNSVLNSDALAAFQEQGIREHAQRVVKGMTATNDFFDNLGDAALKLADLIVESADDGVMNVSQSALIGLMA